MKIELNFNVRKEDEHRILRWVRLFANAVLMAEDETIVDAKLNDEEFPHLYDTAPPDIL